jgi:predicted O-methyltransferase YrrM
MAPPSIARILGFAARRTFSLWERLGLHVTPVHFYQPIPDTRALPPSLWARRLTAPGVDFRDAEQMRLLEDFVADFGAELAELPLDQTPDPRQYYLRNWAYGTVDAEVLYSIIRRFKPRRVIEIGSGQSTLLTAQALRRNAADGATPADFTAIEPYPNKVIRAGIPGLSRLVPTPVQEVPVATFEALEANDVLFIDSSHVVAAGSDVVYEFLEILPRLKPGVIVHVHDIFMPAEYLREWIMDEHRFWTEQYLLQAMLANNPAWEVLWGSSYMHLAHPELLAKAFPSYTAKAWPASLWMRKK